MSDIQYTKEDFARAEERIGLPLETSTPTDAIIAFVRAWAIIDRCDAVFTKHNYDFGIISSLRTMISRIEKRHQRSSSQVQE